MKKTLENFVSIVGDISALFDDFVPEIIISKGLNASLESLCHTVETNYKIKSEFKYFGDGLRLEQEYEIFVYQIIQELVVNVINHANANMLTIDLNKCANHLFIKVIDNGSGIENEKKRNNTEGGLNKIRAKLADKYGWIAISAQPGEGTEVSVEINF